jgi:hypothetical protein
LAEATWRRIGDEVIAFIDDQHRTLYPPPRPFWAEEQFGPRRYAERGAGSASRRAIGGRVTIFRLGLGVRRQSSNAMDDLVCHPCRALRLPACYQGLKFSELLDC